MQSTYVKLKLPEKVLRALILIIMVGLLQCTDGYGQLLCFDPVWKTLVFNDPNGFVYVNKSRQIATSSGAAKYLYKISTDYNTRLRHSNRTAESYAFYLYDPRERRFLCFKNAGGAMHTLTYKSIERKKSWDKCKFSDRIPDDRKYSHQAYVYLELAGHRNTVMQFDKKGRIMPRKRLENCLRNKRAGRHNKRCTPINNFLLYYNANEENNCCHEAFIDLCKGPIRNMAELRDKCAKIRESGCDARHHFG